MLQYKIPQDVGIEDKIVGPLSLRQLIIVAVGVGISYVIYAIAAKMYELNTLEYIVIALPAFIAAAAAFIRINNISFTKFILLTLEFAIKPKKRLWDHRGIAHLVAPDLKEKKIGTAAIVAGGNKRKDVDLDELSRILDSGGFENVKVEKHEDIDKAKDEDLMAEAYFGHKKSESPTENMYWRTKESHKKRLEMLAKLPVTKKQETVPKEAVKTEKTTPQDIRQSPPVVAVKPVMNPQEQTPQAAKAPSPARPEVQPAPQIEKTVPPVQKPIKPPVSQAVRQPASQAQKPLIQKTEKPMPPVQAQPPTKPQTLKPETMNPPVQKTATTEVKKTPEIVPKRQETAPKAETKIQKPIVQPGKPTPAAEAVPPKKPELASQIKPQIPNQAQEGGKKKRRRNKKPKTLMSVRPETQINNTQKNKPVTLMPKDKTEVRRTQDSSGEKPDIRREQQTGKAKNGQAPGTQQSQPAAKEKPVQTDQTGGEIHLEELKKGEITWGF